MDASLSNDAARAVARHDELVKVQGAIRRVVGLLADLPPAEQARWAVHVLAALDPCGPGDDRFAEVLRRVRVVIDRRLESGEW